MNALFDVSNKVVKVETVDEKMHKEFNNLGDDIMEGIHLYYNIKASLI